MTDLEVIDRLDKLEAQVDHFKKENRRLYHRHYAQQVRRKEQYRKFMASIHGKYSARYVQWRKQFKAGDLYRISIILKRMQAENGRRLVYLDANHYAKLYHWLRRDFRKT